MPWKESVAMDAIRARDGAVVLTCARYRVRLAHWLAQTGELLS
jgi:hypothetical protein